MNRTPYAGDGQVRGDRMRRMQQPCLLVVDDQPMNIQALYHVFSADHRVLMATSGEKALEVCRETPPDLILLDVVMPGMDGYEVIRRLKADPATAGIPVIFVTARDGAEDEAQGLALGAVDFIGKPINAAVVRARVRTHIELSRSRALLGATLEATADGILVLDTEGGLVTCNQRFARMWNIPGEMMGGDDERQELQFMQEQMDEAQSDFQSLIDAVHRSGLEASSTVELLDGRILERHLTPLLSEGRVTGYVFSFRDVTLRVRGERAIAELLAHLDEVNASLEDRVRERTEALTEATRQASAANQAKSDFLSNMSHEMRTPLNSILGLSYLALRADPSPKLQEYLERVGESGRHLLGLISNILDFSKIEAGRLEIESVDFNVASMVEDVRRQLAETAQAKGLGLSVQVDPALERPLRGDPLRIRQILLNYVGNAIKFSFHGEVVLRVQSLHEDEQGITLRFEVQDQGIGLSEAQAVQLFQPFHQADTSTTREFGGTGLGLAICRQLAGMMGGEVGVSSTPGVGSSFWLRVSLAWGQAPLPLPRTDPLDRRWDQTLRGRTVLVVDDNALNQRVAFELLQVTGANVVLAGDGLMALQALAHEKADAVLMDVQMPVMDGLEATRRIREEPALAGVRVIAMTANARGEDEAACRNSGMDDFITKPVVPEQLYAMLVKWLGSSVAAPPPQDASAADGAGRSAADGEVIDLNVLIDLTRNNPKMIRNIAAVFLTSLERTVAELEAALAASDRAALAALGHKTKSSAGAVGAMGLSRLCQQLEASMREVSADPASARPLVESIRGLKAPISEKLASILD